MSTHEQDPLKNILQAIEHTYGSWEIPKFHFAKLALDSDMWGDVVARLRARMELIERTDLNNDVSRTLVAQTDGAERGLLQLSFVGPYGSFFRYADEGRKSAYVAREEDATSEMERIIVRLCTEAGIHLLSKQILSVHVPLRLFDTEPESVRVYQALFTDVEYMPGEYKDPPGASGGGSFET